jgi:hypothetical protein
MASSISRKNVYINYKMNTTHLKTVSAVRRALRNLNNWEDEALGMGNRRYAPLTSNQWKNLRAMRERLMRREWALQAAERHAARAPNRARKVFRVYANKLRARIYRPPNAGGAMYRRTAASTALKRTRSVGTSMSPNRRSPKRRNTGTSP